MMLPTIPATIPAGTARSTIAAGLSPHQLAIVAAWRVKGRRCRGLSLLDRWPLAMPRRDRQTASAPRAPHPTARPKCGRTRLAIGARRADRAPRSDEPTSIAATPPAALIRRQCRPRTRAGKIPAARSAKPSAARRPAPIDAIDAIRAAENNRAMPSIIERKSSRIGCARLVHPNLGIGSDDPGDERIAHEHGREQHGDQQRILQVKDRDRQSTAPRRQSRRS